MTGLLKKNRHTEWVDSFKEYEAVEEEKVIRPELHPATDSLSMGEVVRAVSEATRHEAILVTDVGQNQMISARYFKYTRNVVSLLRVDLARWVLAFRQLSELLSAVPTALYVYLWVTADCK